MANRLSRMSRRELESLQEEVIPLHGPTTRRITSSSTINFTPRVPTEGTSSGLGTSRYAKIPAQASTPSPSSSPVLARGSSSTISECTTGGLASSRFATTSQASSINMSPLQRRAAKTVWRIKPKPAPTLTPTPTPPILRSIVHEPSIPTQDPTVTSLQMLTPKSDKRIITMPSSQASAFVKPLVVRKSVSAAFAQPIQSSVKPSSNPIKPESAPIKPTSAPVRATTNLDRPTASLITAHGLSAPGISNIPACMKTNTKQGSTVNTAVADSSNERDLNAEWGLDPADHGFPIIHGPPRPQPVFRQYEHRFVNESDSD
jgi:hypothetical protein